MPGLHAQGGGGSVVKIGKAANGSFQLVCDGQPFTVNGVGGKQRLEQLVQLGGNSIRTWGIDTLEEPVDGKPLIKRAQELKLKVTAGIWVEHERHGFSYDDATAVQKQRDTVRAAVRKYRDEPALLVWGWATKRKALWRAATTTGSGRNSTS